jgi:hypothetical protein
MLPEMTHDSKKSMAQRAFKTEDLAASGNEWRSPAFDLFDKRHPAVTGEKHPQAKEGAGHSSVNTNAVEAARGVTGSNASTTGTTRTSGTY